MHSTTEDPDRNLTSLHRLRGIACLLVVTGHAFGLPAIRDAGYLLQPAYLLIASATVIFVLLAGILFQMKTVPKLAAGQTRTRDILAKRWRELRLFYLTFGLAFAAVISFNRMRENHEDPIYTLVQLMVSGTMANAYWYVPFFLLLMALAPLHVWYARRTTAVQTALIVAGLLVSAFLHRSGAQGFGTNFHNLAYYLPIFWLGMVLGRNWAGVLSMLRGKELLLALLVAAVIAVQMHLGQNGVYLHALGEMSGKVDLFPLQKVALALLLISLLHRSRHMAMPLIDWCARNSLTIFFLHGPIFIPLSYLPAVTGLYIPELVAFTAVMLYGSIRLDEALYNTVFRKLPKAAPRGQQLAS